MEQEVKKDFAFWLPVIAGIVAGATPEELEYATAHDLAVLNHVALEKIKLMRGGL